MDSLVKKYNVPTPRYTSYPTVPYWDTDKFDRTTYLNHIRDGVQEKPNEGISLYVHLPYCESLCTYCGCNKRITKNHKVEKPYIDAVIKEWQLYVNHIGKKPHVSELHFGGGTPSFFSPINLRKLIEALTRNAIIPSDAEFSFEGHPNNTSDSHLQTLRLMGFKRVSLGVQDFDPVVQRTINRIQSFSQVRHVTEKARKVGFRSVNFDLIYGLPKQTLSSIQDTIDKVLVLKPDRIAFYSYAHVPWKSPSQRGYDDSDLPDDEEKKGLYELGRTLLLEGGYVEIGMDHFGQPSDDMTIASANGSLHRNFMGYSTQHNQMMIGLGVSAIGDSWNSFGQNAKSVEGYLEKISKGEFPIVKGHILSERDLYIRQAILDLMCQYHCAWEPEKLSNDIEALKMRLEDLSMDGLLEVTSEGISVKKEGELFIRNICLAIDARYWNNRPQDSVFSKSI